MPVDQLVELTDTGLVDQALQLLTTANFSGSVSLPDGSAVSMRDCILELVGNSTVRGGREIMKQSTWNDSRTSATMTNQKFYLTIISQA
jgi:hypothetical protein